jgi:hypothetical protein
MHISNFSKTEKNVVTELDLIIIVSMVSKLCHSAGILILKSCKLQKVSRRGVILVGIVGSNAIGIIQKPLESFGKGNSLDPRNYVPKTLSDPEGKQSESHHSTPRGCAAIVTIRLSQRLFNDIHGLVECFAPMKCDILPGIGRM